MSYCVECGVELARDLKKCPLCDTPVLNPRQPAPEAAENPYPDAIEEAISHMDRGYARQLAVIAALARVSPASKARRRSVLSAVKASRSPILPLSPVSGRWAAS